MRAEQRLRIAFDARHSGRGLGISTFITSLANELTAHDDVELIWLGDPHHAPKGIPRIVALHRLPYPLFDGPGGRILTRRLGVDVVHFTGNTGWTRPGPVPSVLSLHDLIFLRSHGSDRSVRQIVGHRYERWLIERALHCATQVVVPSQTVAADVQGRFGLSLAVRVIYEGVSSSPRAGRGEPPVPYVVAFAGRDPRKETSAIIDAWHMVADMPLNLKLLASAGLPEGARESLAPAIATGAAEIIGHVPRQELASIIAGACALAYPSRDEGFGLPVLEAMAVGTPVLSGLAPVTLEVGGDALIQLDPRDVAGSMAAGFRRLREDHNFRRLAAERGRQRAAAFTWAQTAQAYTAIYREVAKERGRRKIS